MEKGREVALEFGESNSDLAQKLQSQFQVRALTQNRKWLALLFSFVIASALWNIPPPTGLDKGGMRFLASLAAGVMLWISNVLDEYIVAMMLLFVWLITGIVRPEVALAGFSESSWFFLLGVLGIGAAVARSGLLNRLALQLLRRIGPDYKTSTLILFASGLLVTPLLPDDRGRVAIMAPISKRIAEIMGFKSRSSCCAGLVLSAYIGLSQMAFMFLTGATTCVIGWNLLPESAKLEFGWGMWTLAALPAGIFTLLFLFAAIHLLFPLKKQGGDPALSEAKQTQGVERLEPLTRGEWLSLIGLGLAFVGWAGKPIHGISEAGVALFALLFFLIAGVLDKSGLKNNIDWGFLLFFGVVSGMAGIMSHLQVDRWLMGFVDPVLFAFSFHPLSSLISVTLLVYFVRFFLNKTPTVMLLSLGLAPWAEQVGIHPGILLLTILMAVDSWFFPYQTINYQIAYYSTDEKAFSHAQARKLMVAKFFSSILAVMISIPYWRMLGFLH